jgi:hypothetical protein
LKEEHACGNVGQDENGNRKIFFDDPKADHADGKDDRSGEGEDGKGPRRQAETMCILPL